MCQLSALTAPSPPFTPWYPPAVLTVPPRSLTSWYPPLFGDAKHSFSNGFQFFPKEAPQEPGNPGNTSIENTNDQCNRGSRGDAMKLY